LRRIIPEALFPPLKVHRAAERSEHYKLGECNPGALRKVLCCLKCVGMVGRQSEDEGSEHMDSVLLKLAETLHQVFAG